jgi:tetratricopeptide (TPR) repeat protein
MLRIGEYDKANALYAAIVEAKTLPWAKLGVARALVGSGQLTHAVDALSALINEDPSNGDAYDVMGRAQLELGNMGEALQTYQMACNLTPNSITRMQNLANIMFSVGRLADAEKLLGRAALIGKDSKMFDPQSLVTLAFTRLAGNDRKGLQNCVDDFQRLMGKRPKSDKLTGQASVIQALLDIHTGQNAKALDQLKSLGALAKQRDFGFDMACNCLALAAQLAKRKADASFDEELSKTISLRFVTNRPRMELLAGAALQHPPLSAKVREISAQVFQISRDAIKLALQGEPATATVRLLSAGRATLNSKLIETAGLLLKRYASKITNGPELEAEFKSLTLNFGENSNGRAGSDQPREAGGLKLRIGNSEDV